MLIQLEINFFLIVNKLFQIISILLIIGDVNLVKSVSGVHRVVKIGKLNN